MNITAAVLFALAISCEIAFAQTPLVPGQLLENSSAYDGKLVTATGEITNVVHKTSKAGNAYTTFDLCTIRLNARAHTQCVHVFQYGSPPLVTGQGTTVTGIFSVEKHVGSSVFHNEIDVEH